MGQIISCFLSRPTDSHRGFKGKFCRRYFSDRRNDAASIDMEPCHDREIRSASALINLPVELVCQIREHLDPLAIRALSYTCHYLRDMIDLESHGDRNLLRTYKGRPQAFCTGNDSPFRSECLGILIMLERDGKIPDERLVCNPCGTTHAKEFFPPQSESTCSSERMCIGHAGRIWVCPHIQLNHAEVQSAHWPSNGGLKAPAICKACRQTVVYHLPHTIVRFPLLTILDDTSLDNSNVRMLLGTLHAAVCQHLRLSNPFVSTIYDKECKMMELIIKARIPDDCICSSCKVGRNCPQCATSFLFWIRNCSRGVQILTLSVFRSPFQGGVLSEKWKQQIVQPG